MKYTAKLPETNLNVSNEPVLFQALRYFAIISAFLLIFWLLSGFLVSRFAQRVPISWEDKLSGITPGASMVVEDPRRERVQEILDRLVSQLPNAESYPDSWFKVRVWKMDLPNAGASFAGQIFVTTGLLDQVDSEEGLAMVLGHELGHVVNRDVIRSLGRRLLLVFVSSLFGADDIAGKLIAPVLSIGELKYSRDQETACDDIGLELVHKVWGHVGGTDEFFSELLKEGEIPVGVFSSHPLTSDRLEHMEKLREEKNYKLKEPTPLTFH